MRRVAGIVSVVVHPFVVLPAAIIVASAHRWPWRQTAALLAVIAAAILTLSAYVARGVKRGRLGNLDVSEREQRNKPYRIALGLIAGIFVWMRATHQPSGGALGALVVLIGSAVLNRWVKASQHTAFAVFSAALVAGTAPAWLPVFATAALAVAWSRVALGRHTWPEIAAGGAMGLLGGLVMFFT